MVAETLPQTAPFEPTTPIKPSEAIRLGCLIAPIQLFDRGYVDYNSEQGACVYGAMALGFGPSGRFQNQWVDAGHVASVIHSENGIVDGSMECPEGDHPLVSLVHLNDEHRWSRERIADWLAEQGL